MRVEFSNEFEDWFNALNQKTNERVVKIIDMLEMMGQGLVGTKYAKSIVGSRDIFELVIQTSGQPYRVLYGLINESAVVLLIGGNKLSCCLSAATRRVTSDSISAKSREPKPCWQCG